MVRRRRTCLGFTVLELVLAAAAVGALLSMLLPAVQVARESARRAECRSHLRRLGMALHAYHAASACFPPGVVWNGHQYAPPRMPYLPFLFPYLGEGALYARIDWDGRGDILWCRGRNADVVRVALPVLLCPSDGLGGRTKWNPYCGEQAVTNYMGFFGETMGDVPLRKAVFGANRATRFSEIGDGASQTLAMGEYITGTPKDLRGQMWADEAGASLLFTGLGPNSSRPDLLYPNPAIWDASDPEVNDPGRNMPSSYGDGFTTDTAASRSRHPGGVHVLFVDGNVRRVANAVSLDVWRRLGTMSDGERVPDL